MWALVQILDEPGKLNVYLFTEGYLRTSSQEYSLNSEDLMVHLTNICLQNKEKQTFGKHEDGNTVSF
jgi:hypothetical protein